MFLCPVSMEILPATSLFNILFHRNWIDDFNKQDMNNFIITNGYDEENALENSDIEVTAYTQTVRLKQIGECFVF